MLKSPALRTLLSTISHTNFPSKLWYKKYLPYSFYPK